MSSLCPLTECGHPIIDVEKLKRGSDAEASALGAALGDYGYFYAANVEGLSAEYIRSLYAYSGRCHALPAAVKHKYRQRGGTGVYSGPDIGQPELQYEAEGAAARVCGWDYSRARFSLGDGVTEGDARYPSAADRGCVGRLLRPPGRRRESAAGRLRAGAVGAAAHVAADV